MKDGKIDINTIIGFLLIGGILLYFGYFSQPDTPPQDQTIDQADSVQVVEETRELEEVDTIVPLADSLKTPSMFGPFGMAADPDAEVKTYTIENEILEVVISSRGGQVVEARLKNYQTWDSLPLYLINQNSRFNLTLNTPDKDYNTADLNFKGKQSGSDQVVMSLAAEGGGSLEYHYKLDPDNYMLQWDIVSESMDDYMDDTALLAWEMKTLRHEKNVENERTATALEYHFANEDDMDDLSVSGEDEEKESNIRWVACKQQFFSTILWSKRGQFDQAELKSHALEQEDVTKVLYAGLSLNKVGDDVNMPLGLYLGPNKYDVLKAYDQDFDKLIPLGWGILGWINRGIVINIFNWLEGYGLNYGLIILIIALLIKLILFPLTYSSYRSMAKMRVLKPEIDELNEEYKDKDPMKKQQATMQLYQKAGVNPLGGCIPVLLQFPILIALFRFFPASIELRQQSFLWADDLSTYDSIWNLPFNIPFYGDHVSLFTLLMTVSTLIYTYMNQQLTGQNQQYPQLKYMVYLMPIVFLGVFNNYAAGLSYYYFVANMITFGQQFAIRAYIDEDKIHAKMQEKKKQPTKENRFMRRMRELQEQQEQNTRQGRRKK
ncbi:MAG: membrane protein insertase YidC [Owenweeksia sp.]|nr:membrane protein insertase YidC [Owenweeksia sp.]MBF99831.1 membrane protein insertase YidC [Owenweeksia sp.]HBF21761.1 membrane protein insertase YidC [Cryomorphaceae bacterium]